LTDDGMGGLVSFRPWKKINTSKIRCDMGMALKKSNKTQQHAW
jgi:hypothetical protein